VHKRKPVQPKVVLAELAPALDDACSHLTGAASLQCLHCSFETGFSWLLCQERARLEYCEHREGADAACPSVIPTSPPN
jgi:hypothetical protein